MLLRVQVDVLERAFVDLAVDFVEELELVALELVAHDPFHDVVLVDEHDDLLRHLDVSLYVVRTPQRTQFVHGAQLVDEVIVGGFEWVQVEPEGRLL